MKKRIASELCDKEKLADSFVVVGESYQKLRNFPKARKWYTKSWEIYKMIGNLEGQAIVKINMGDVLDSEGDWEGALKTFEEGYRIAVQANKIAVQISALENMHYSSMMRFDNVEEARRLQLQIDNLKTLISSEQEAHIASKDSCSETDTEGNDIFSKSRPNASGSSRSSESLPMGKPVSCIEEVEDDEALSSFLRSGKKLQKVETHCEGRVKRFSTITKACSKSLSKSPSSPLTSLGRKRTRLVLSDDEDDVDCSNGRLDTDTVEDVATSIECAKGRSALPGLARDLEDFIPDACKHDISSCNPFNIEESASSYKSSTPEEAVGWNLKSSGNNKPCIRMKVEDVCVCIEAESCMFADELDIEDLKIQAACLYYLQLSSQKRTSGLLPIIGHAKSRDQVLAYNEEVETIMTDTQGWIEASIKGWVQKRLIKMYVDCCEKVSETPNMKLLKKLYNLEVSEDEVIVSDCELQDMSIVPLLEALHAQQNIAMLDLSHNMLGNATMERLQQVLTMSDQKYGALVLDLHCNMFGPTTLFQICECPALFSRLEVLNISGNRLTDACGICLSTILENCKALYSLNVEHCSITSRTIQKIADSIGSGSVLSQLSIGHNNPISGSSLAILLGKLSTLKRFSDLSLNGLKLNKPALDSVCLLARFSSLSSLMVGSTNIGCDGALQLTESLFRGTQDLVKLNLSYCGITPNYLERLKTHTPTVWNILELNLAGNPIMPQGGTAIASLLADPQCSMKVLTLNKCHLGLSGVIQIIKSLAENDSLEEANLAGNIEREPHRSLENDSTDKKSSEVLDPGNEHQNPAVNGCSRVDQHEASHSKQQGEEQPALDQLEAADSYKNDTRVELAESGLDDSCTSQGRLDDSCTSQGRGNATRSDHRTIEELSANISNAERLQLLDLSNNGFSTEEAHRFYNAWSSGTRAGLARKHVKGKILHLYLHGKWCCGVKPCCQRD